MSFLAAFQRADKLAGDSSAVLKQRRPGRLIERR
jgi:hypothetical protein